MAQSSFRMDEGYSEFPAGDDEWSSQGGRLPAPSKDGEPQALPNWLMNLTPAVRAELAYSLIRTLPTSRISALVERLMPILHLDFIHLLPSEITLQIFSLLDTKSLLNASLTSKSWRRYALEPEVWKRKYAEEGWGADFEEANRFERQIAQNAEEQFKAEVESKRIAAESDNAARSSRARGGRSGFASPGLSRQGNERDRFARGLAGLLVTQQQFDESPTALSEDEEMYPSPLMPQTNSQLDNESLEYSTSLITSDWRNPRLNWLYLYKNRQKLENNWLKNRSTAFQIPHPNFQKEGHKECIYTIQYSANFVVSGSRDRTIRIWNLNTRRLVRPPLKGHDGSVLCLQFDDRSDEDIIISGSSDASIIIWKFSTGQILRRLPNAHSESVLNLRFNKKYLVTCSKDKAIKVWNRSDLAPHDPDYPYSSRHIFGNDRLTRCVNVVDSRMYGISQSLPIPYAKPIEAYSVIHVFTGHNAAVNSIQLHDDEIVSASGDRSLKVWSIREGGCEMTLLGHTKGIACVQYDGENIVSGSSDCNIRIYSREKGTELATLEGHKDLVRTVQARLSGVKDSMKKIVSGSYDEDVRVWRMEKGEWVAGGTLRQSFTRPVPHHPLPANPHLAPSVQGPAIGAGTGPANNHTVQSAVANAVQAAAAASSHVAGNAPHPPPLVMPAALVAPNRPVPVQAIRVFKLQFDARLIVCCSQDSRIGGWDFAMDDPGIIESSRFFT